MKEYASGLLIILILATSLSAQSNDATPQKPVINVDVIDLQLEAKNINLLLSEIAYKYGVPISLEVAADDDLSKSTRLTVELKSGTLANVLDRIVQQKPSYTWEVTDKTIRVFPKNAARDPVLHALLETKISRFVIQKPTTKYTFREMLTRRPELEALLASNGVSPSNETFSSYDVRPFGRDFSMDLAEVRVRSILDYVIKNSPTKYWFINRHGEHRQYLLLNF